MPEQRSRRRTSFRSLFGVFIDIELRRHCEAVSAAQRVRERTSSLTHRTTQEPSRVGRARDVETSSAGTTRPMLAVAEADAGR